MSLTDISILDIFIHESEKSRKIEEEKRPCLYVEDYEIVKSNNETNNYKEEKRVIILEI
jgi:hypothetical protein